ncbi:MAG: aspartate ammonia-lyase, partial [Actinomycetota bacterium]|nr:aspartate ammonia-lyase [Actinomycetota bacterium]
MASRVQTGLVGAAGEYYVAAELSRRGWLATVTIKNAPGTDVLAQHGDQRELAVSIQTKTSSNTNSFQIGAKAESVATGDRQWFVLVGLTPLGERPVFYIVPHDVVAGCIFA